MLATLTDRRDFGEDWLLERKFDGERCVARKDGVAVRLESRTAKDLTGTYPEVCAPPSRHSGAPDSARRRGRRVRRGADSFSRLQQRLGVASPSAELMAAVPGRLLRLRPARARRRRPHRPAFARASRTLAGGPAGCARCAQRSVARGLAAAVRARPAGAGWEGLIAKRADAPYVAGRSRDWLKLKCAGSRSS